MHAFGVPCDPPPTIAFTGIFEFPDSVNDRERLESVFNEKREYELKILDLYTILSQSNTWVWTHCILNATEIALRSNAYAVILIRKLASNGRIKIEAFYSTIYTSMIL